METIREIQTILDDLNNPQLEPKKIERAYFFFSDGDGCYGEIAKKYLKIIARNPNTPGFILGNLWQDGFSEVARNPSTPLLILEGEESLIYARLEAELFERLKALQWSQIAALDCRNHRSQSALERHANQQKNPRLYLNKLHGVLVNISLTGLYDRHAEGERYANYKARISNLEKLKAELDLKHPKEERPHG